MSSPAATLSIDVRGGKHVVNVTLHHLEVAYQWEVAYQCHCHRLPVSLLPAFPLVARLVLATVLMTPIYMVLWTRSQTTSRQRF